MANKVLISCDSTADLSPELASRFDIKICSQMIIMDDTTYYDMVNVVPADLFEYARKTGKLAKTCAMNTAGFVEFFTPYLEQGFDIVHFDISAEMSVSYNNCKLAAEELSESFTGRIYPVDSRSLSTGIGLLALRAARLRDSGATAAEIAENVREAAGRLDVSFVLDTLEFMHKGGRCSSVAALGANLLKLKPCIEVVGGKMDVGKKYRGKQTAVMDEYIEARLRDVQNIDSTEIFITHSESPPEIVEQVRKKIMSLIPFGEIHETKAGCSISVHSGPNTLGVLFFRAR